MGRSLAWMSAVAAVAVLLICMGLAAPIDFAVALFLGWTWYLARTLPEVQVALPAITTAAVCLICFVAGSHVFLGWLYQEIRSRSGTKAPEDAQWKWRWTSGLAVTVVLLFAAGMATVGVTHQLGWLLTSREPWFSSESGAMNRAISTNNLKQIGLALHGYHQAHGALPPGGRFDPEGRALESWQTLILPFTDHAELHDRLDVSIPWTAVRNAPVFQTEIPFYLHPGILAHANAAGYALSHFAANVHVLGGDHSRSFDDVSD
jgi:hypothetical protein